MRKNKYLDYNTNSRDEIIGYYLPMVRSIVKKLEVDEKYYEDLIHVGMIGVINAYDNYNHDTTKSLLWNIIYSNIIKRISKFIKEEERITGVKLFFAPPEQIRSIDRQEFLEIETIPFDDDCTLNACERYVEEIALNKREIEEIISISNLSTRELTILVYFFGLYDQPAIRLEDIGKIYNITRARVGQIKDKALAKCFNAIEKRDKIGTRDEGCIKGIL